jgi:hypothetical protein
MEWNTTNSTIGVEKLGFYIIQRIVLVMNNKSAAVILHAGRNYTHEEINHNQNFVDPGNRQIHTQNVESMWSTFKKSHIKKPNGVNSELFGQYVVDYVWKRMFGGDDAMYNLWTQITHIYPTDN